MRLNHFFSPETKFGSEREVVFFFLFIVSIMKENLNQQEKTVLADHKIKQKNEIERKKVQSVKSRMKKQTG